MHIEEAKVQPGYVIQVIVNPEKTDDSPAKTSWIYIRVWSDQTHH